MAMTLREHQEYNQTKMRELRDTFSARLRSAMDLRGVDDRGLANAINSTPMTVIDLANSRSTPSFARVLSIAMALDVTIDYLAGLEDSPERASAPFSNGVQPKATAVTMANARASIRALMDKRGVSQRDLGKAIGTSGPNVCRLLTGERDTLDRYINDIAKFFGVETSDLFKVGVVTEDTIKEQNKNGEIEDTINTVRSLITDEGSSRELNNAEDRLDECYYWVQMHRNMSRQEDSK